MGACCCCRLTFNERRLVCAVSHWGLRPQPGLDMVNPGRRRSTAVQVHDNTVRAVLESRS